MRAIQTKAKSNTVTTQRMRFFSKIFFSKCGQVHSFLRIRSHLLKKSLVENFIFVQCFSIFLLLFWRPFNSQEPNCIFGTRNVILFTENSICWRNAEIWCCIWSKYVAEIFEKDPVCVCVCVCFCVHLCVCVSNIPFIIPLPSW